MTPKSIDLSRRDPGALILCIRIIASLRCEFVGRSLLIDHRPHRWAMNAEDTTKEAKVRCFLYGKKKPKGFHVV